MKHNTLRTAASLAACLLSAVIVICGCQKDKLDPAKAASAAVAESDFELTVAVSYGPSTNTKTTITQSSTILPVKWKAGDKLYVVGATDGYLGSLTQTGDLSGDPVGRTAYFKGNVKGWTTAQVLHIYYLGDAPTIDTDNNTFSFDISSQEGTLAWIASNGHIAHGATASLAPGTQTIAKATSPLTMSNLNAVILYDLSAWTGGVEISGTYNSAVLNLKTGAFDTKTAGDISLASDKCTATTYVTFIPDNKALTFTDGKATTPTKANNVEAGKFYSNAAAAIVIPKLEPDYAIPGKISVSPTKIVQFSCGNLRYTVSTGKWDFYEKQYECAPSYESTVCSMFTWSYGPWSTTPGTTTYGYAVPFSDWGSQVGDGSTWFTLSNDEWNYIFTGRTNASNLAKHNVTVCGKTNCLVIAPDNWDTTSCPLQETYDESSTPLTWSQAEEEGLVCLPAAGQRIDNATSVTGVGSIGSYWSSTPANASSKYYTRFDATSHRANEFTEGYVGLSVRLVKDAPLPHYFEGEYDYGEGIEIDGTIWAPVNCGIGGMISGETKNQYPYGKLYQWGRKVGTGYNTGVAPYNVETRQEAVAASGCFTDGFNKTPADDKFYWTSSIASPFDWYTNASASQFPSWPLTDPVGTSGIGNPCPDGWRVPTVDELGNLCFTNWNSTTHTGSVRRGDFDDTNKAYNFGSISFPYAGYRTYDSEYGFGARDSQCRYWSSTVSVNEPVKAYCWESAGALGFAVFGSARADGFSVRCVYAGE